MVKEYVTESYFRGLRCKAKDAVGNWVVGWLVVDSKKSGMIVQEHDLTAVDVNVGTLCRGTGFVDSSGNDLWEHDIVRGIELDIWGEVLYGVNGQNLGWYIRWFHGEGVDVDWYRQEFWYWLERLERVGSRLD